MNEHPIIINRLSLTGELCYQNTTLLTYQIDYPQMKSVRYAQTVPSINQFYQTEATEFEKYCRLELYPDALNQFHYSLEHALTVIPYEAMVTYKVTYNANGIVSLYFDRYLFTGGAHGTTKRYSDTWDLKTGRRLKLKDFYPEGTDCKARLLAEIALQISRAPDQFFEDYHKLLQESFNAADFYMTDEGIVIYFQQYDIAPYSSGIPQFLIPFGQKHS